MSLTSGVYGATIIGFSGDSPGANTLLTGLSTTWQDGIYSIPFSESNLVFSGDTATNAPAIYGGVYATNTNTTATPLPIASYVRGDANPDQIRLGWQRSPSNSTLFRFLIMSPSSAWLNLNEGASFDTLSSLSKTAQLVSGGNFTSSEVRFVVKDNGQYYASNPNTDITDPNSASWKLFDPSTFGQVNFISLPAAPHIFSQIEGVGLFIQGRAISGGTNDAYFALTSWSIQAAAIPEPSPLLTVALAVLVSQFNRRRSKPS